MPHRIRAVIWDFDNTLADSRAKNWRVTSRIIERATGVDPSTFPALATLEAYDAAMHRTQDWREFYEVEFGLDRSTIEEAGTLWTDLHLADRTPTPGFQGVAEAVRALNDRPQAIVSLNTRGTIEPWLEREGLSDVFELVIGCEEVGADGQKPAPDGLLACLDALLGETVGRAVYVGDHSIDAECTLNANGVLEARSDPRRFVSVGAFYGTVQEQGWPHPPMHAARSPGEVVRIVHELDREHVAGFGSAR